MRFAAFDLDVVLSEIDTDREGGFEGARAGEAEGDAEAFAEEDDAVALADAVDVAASRCAREEGRAGRGWFLGFPIEIVRGAGGLGSVADRGGR